MRLRVKEADVLSACLAYLAWRGVFAWRSNNAGVFDPARKCFRSFRGLKGVSDILGVLPGSGKLLAVECKRQGGKLSAEQELFQQKVAELGGIAVCVRDVVELEGALRQAGVT